VFTEINARTVVVTWFHRTVIYNRAIRIFIALRTFAFVTGDTVKANLVIQAYYAYAIVNIHVAHLVNIAY